MEEPTESFPLITIDREGCACRFDCTYHYSTYPRETWTYSVRAPTSADFYEARFVAVGVERVQPDVLDRHYRPEYKAKGITEALFERVVGDSGRTLISSSNRGPKHVDAEFRSLSADKAWRRLESLGRATYDSATDRYTFMPRIGSVVVAQDTSGPRLPTDAAGGEHLE